jgi:hypothetical protein
MSFYFCRLSTTLKGRLTEEEVVALKEGLIASGRIPQAIEVLEGVIELAQSLPQESEREKIIAPVREEIIKLKKQHTQQENQQKSHRDQEEQEQRETTQWMDHSHDCEIFSESSSPSPSVNSHIAHLSDVLSVQIVEAEVRFTHFYLTLFRVEEKWISFLYSFRSM